MKMYGYKKCGTCRNAEKMLTEMGITYEFTDITTNPPSREELAQIQKLSGTAVTKLFNTSGVVYREQNIKDKIKGMSESEMLDLLASDGKLIKRPLITDGTSASVGFSEELFASLWK